MREDFYINRHGKQYVLFAGLLDEAHNRGLRSIDTTPIQLPTEENGQVAIFKATVEMEDGRLFSGIGDASPDNVGRNIVPHIIRMAETRAKARALRDAVNVGAAALEELGGDADAPASVSSLQPVEADASEASEGEPHTKEELIDYLRHLAQQKGRSEEEIEALEQKWRQRTPTALEKLVVHAEREVAEMMES